MKTLIAIAAALLLATTTRAQDKPIPCGLAGSAGELPWDVLVLGESEIDELPAHLELLEGGAGFVVRFIIPEYDSAGRIRCLNLVFFNPAFPGFPVTDSSLLGQAEAVEPPIDR